MDLAGESGHVEYFQYNHWIGILDKQPENLVGPPFPQGDDPFDRYLERLCWFQSTTTISCAQHDELKRYRIPPLGIATIVIWEFLSPQLLQSSRL